MSLLTLDNLLNYAPGLPPEAAIETAIYMAESLAYGPNGSGYDLGLTDRVEIKRLSMANEVIPTYSISNLTTVAVDYRSVRIDNEWHPIEPSSLEVTARRIRVKSSSQVLRPSGDFGRRGAYRDRPLYGSAENELRISYTSGIDFAVETPEVHRLRSALGGIVMAQYAASKGMGQLTDDGCCDDGGTGTAPGQKVLKKSVLGGRAVLEYSNPDSAAVTAANLLRIGSSSGAVNGAIADCLAVFRQYQVRSIVG